MCGFRWYDPDLGRWLSRDPIGYGGGDNLYAYCDGDPLGFADPLGLLSLGGIGRAIAWPFVKAGQAVGWVGHKVWNGVKYVFTAGMVWKRNTPTLRNAYIDPACPETGEINGRYLRLGKPINQWINFVGANGMLIGIGSITEVANGLGGASPGLIELYSSGSIEENSLIGIRDVLLRNGFTQTKAGGFGYLFRNDIGEEVRLMYSDGQWYMRVMNRYGNYLDLLGNPNTNEYTHIRVTCR